MRAPQQYAWAPRLGGVVSLTVILLYLLAVAVVCGCPGVHAQQPTTSPGGFTYVPAPTIASVTPNEGPVAGGTAVVIAGTNFQPGATVSFGGVAATAVTVKSATEIDATTPPHAAGAVDVVVTNPH